MLATKLPSLLLAALLLTSCLQSVIEEILLDYIPASGDIRSNSFSGDGADLLIARVYGGILQQDLDSTHFTLVRGVERIPLGAPYRSDDEHILFSFASPLAVGSYRLVMSPQAVLSIPGHHVRRLAVTPIAGRRTVNNTDTIFGNNAVHGISYATGRFIAVGAGGTMIRSTDGGGRWEPIRSGEGPGSNRFVNDVFDIAGRTVSNNMFYAAGADARMSFSFNGFDWFGHRRHGIDEYGESWFIQGENRHAIRAVVYGTDRSRTTGRFVAAGDAGRIIFMWDGDTWRDAFIPSHYGSPSIHTLAWGDVVINLSPGDPNHWQNGVFIAAGSGGAVFRSNEGISGGRGTMWWERAHANVLGDNNTVRASAFGNGVFVVGGDGGRLARSDNGWFWDAAVTWPFDNVPILDIAFGSGMFIAVGEQGRMAYSVDGSNWNLFLDNGFAPGPNGDRISGIATDGRGKFIAVGNNKESGTSRIVSWYQRPLSE